MSISDHKNKTSIIFSNKPIINFSADIVLGIAPLTVQFTDESEKEPTEWLWNFGDGNTSDEQHPEHIYETPGVYNVSLTATNAFGYKTLTKNAFINVGLEPVAEFSANITSGVTPLTVQFTDESENTPTEWLWDFGDGNTSTLQNPQHTYSANGVYDVSLTVTNAFGDDTTIKVEYIVAGLLPVVEFSADITSGSIPLTVQFTDESENNPTSWFWNFGDGNSSTEQNPEHTYTVEDVYNVSLTATNEFGDRTLIKYSFVTAEPAPAQTGIYASKAAAESEGLKYYWKFNEATGTIAYSNTSVPVNLDLYNSTWTIFKENLDTAVSFNGSTSYAQTTLNFIFAEKGIISFACKRLRQNANETIFRNINDPDETMFFANFLSDNKLYIQIYKGQMFAYIIITTVDTFLSGNDYFFNIEYDLSIHPNPVVNIYCNGVLINSYITGNGQSMAGFTADYTQLTIGAEPNGGNFFQGNFDEFFYFSNKTFADLSFTPADWYNAGNGKELF